MQKEPTPHAAQIPGMNISHIVPQIEQEASGPSYSVPRLCQALADCGNAVELKCIAANRSVPGVQLSIYPGWPVLKRFEVSTALARSLGRTRRDADIIHNHSLWSMVNVAAGCMVPGHKAKLVTSPRGTLAAHALARSRLRKRLLWPVQKRALWRAAMLHATSDAEYADIRATGIKVPVAIIPNGIDLPPLRPAERTDGLRTLLYLGRIHPIKGIDNLLRVWQRLQRAHAQWRLAIAGTGEPEHIADVRGLARSLGVERVHFPGPLYGDAKRAAYFDADLFVLPTHSENFGMVVAEALAHGCPAIVTHGAPWQGLQTEQCGWWIEDNIDALEHALQGALSLSSAQLRDMGQLGRDWMARDFSWQAIGRQMDSAYRWLLDGGTPPQWVKLE